MLDTATLFKMVGFSDMPVRKPAVTFTQADNRVLGAVKSGCQTTASIMKKTGCSNGAVLCALRKLESANLIERTRRGDKTRAYIVRLKNGATHG